MKQTKKELFFSNFESKIYPEKVCKNELEACEMINLKISHGKLCSCGGFSSLFLELFGENYDNFMTLNSSVTDKLIYVFIYDYFDEPENKTLSRYFFLDKNYALYELDISSFILNLQPLHFDSDFKVIFDAKKAYIISQKTECAVIEDYYPIVVLSDLPKIMDFCTCSNYSYFTVLGNNFSVFFCEETQIENLSSDIFNYERVELESSGGKILKLLAVSGYIYAVQEFGISKISCTGTVRDMSFCKLPFKVTDNTICAYSDRIIFMSSCGLVSSDGESFSLEFSDFSDKILSSKNAAIFAAKYYLLGDFFINQKSMRAVCEFDLNNNTCTFFDTDGAENIYSLCSQNYYGLALTKELNGTCLNCGYSAHCSENTKYAKFNKITFGNFGKKTLSEISLLCSGKFVLKITSNTGSVFFDITENFSVKNIGLLGRYFEIEIFGTEDFNINSISITAILESEL